MNRSLAIATVIGFSLSCGIALSGQDKAADKSPWEAVPIIPHKGEEKFRRIAFVSRDLGYIAGNKAVYKTEDGGKNWKPVFEAAFLNQGHINYLHFKDAKNGWLGTSRKSYFTEDGGETWAPIDADIPTDQMAIGPNGWLLAGGGSVAQQRGPKAKWETIDLGKAVQDPGFYNVPLISITGPQSAFILLNGNLQIRCFVLKTTDGGKSWKQVFTREHRLSGMQFVDDKRGWITGNASLWMTEDGGETWKAQVNPVEKELKFLAFGPSGSMFGVAPVYSGPGLVYTTNGKQWRSVELDLKDMNFQDASVVDNKCAYVLSEDGSILRFLDTGK